MDCYSEEIFLTFLGFKPEGMLPLEEHDQNIVIRS